MPVKIKLGLSFGVVIVGLWPAEERHYTIAEILGDVTAETVDRVCRDALIPTHRLSPFLGVEPGRDRS